MATPDVSTTSAVGHGSYSRSSTSCHFGQPEAIYVHGPRLDTPTMFLHVAADEFDLDQPCRRLRREPLPQVARVGDGIDGVDDDPQAETQVLAGEPAGDEIALGTVDGLAGIAHGLFDGIDAQVHGLEVFRDTGCQGRLPGSGQAAQDDEHRGGQNGRRLSVCGHQRAVRRNGTRASKASRVPIRSSVSAA